MHEIRVLDLDAGRLMVEEGVVKAAVRKLHLAARVTMRWDAARPAKGRGGARASDASLARIDAHRRFHAAIDHVGPGLADICWRVICAGEGIGGAEQALGWPARSGKLVLGLALDRLARFYGTG